MFYMWFIQQRHQTLNYTVLTGKMIMNNELDSISSEETVATCQGIFQNLSPGTEGKHKNHRAAGIPAEFRSRYLSEQ